MSGDDDKVAESLQIEGFDDFSDQIAESRGLDVDRPREHPAGKGVIQRGSNQTVQFFCKRGRNEFCVADIGIQRQMSAVLFTQTVGNEDRFVVFEIRLHFRKSAVQHFVMFESHIIYLLSFRGQLQ